MAAGSTPTIYKPSIWVAERKTALPSTSLAFRSAWPAGWAKFQGLPEDATLDFSNPKEGIKTKDLGELDRVPTGEDSIGLKMSTAVPKAVDLTRAYNLVRSAVAASTVAGSEHPAFEHAYFDPHADTNFMIGLEGYARAGGLYDNERFVRAFIYNVEQAEEGGRGGGGGGGGGRRGGGGGGGGRGGNASGEPGQMKFGWSNEGAVVVAYQIKAFTEPGRDTLVAGTGYDSAPQLDPQARLDLFYIEIPPTA